jgi:hypothetical protein
MKTINKQVITIPNNIDHSDNLVDCYVRNVDFSGIEDVICQGCHFVDCIIPTSWILSGCRIDDQYTREQELLSMQNVELAKKSVITKAILGISPKLVGMEELSAQLGQLSAAVCSVANASVSLTDIAIEGINDILNDPQIIANTELHSMLLTARDTVVNITSGELE